MFTITAIAGLAAWKAFRGAYEGGGAGMIAGAGSGVANYFTQKVGVTVDAGYTFADGFSGSVSYGGPADGVMQALGAEVGFNYSERDGFGLTASIGQGINLSAETNLRTGASSVTGSQQLNYGTAHLGVGYTQNSNGSNSYNLSYGGGGVTSNLTYGSQSGFNASSSYSLVEFNQATGLIDPKGRIPIPAGQAGSNRNLTNNIWDGLGYMVGGMGTKFSNDVGESWGNIGRGIRDGVNSIGNAISSGWNGVKDTVGNWFGGGKKDYDYMFMHMRGGTKSPTDPPIGPATRSPIESAKELQKLADASGIPITELNKLFATDVQIGLRFDGERIVSVPGEGSQHNGTEMKGSYDHEIHEYVGETSGITNVKDLNGKPIKAVNGHFYVNDGTSWRDITDLQFVAPDGKKLTVGGYWGNEGSEISSAETDGWDLNGKKSEPTAEILDRYKPWNPLVHPDTYKTYQTMQLNEIRKAKYDRSTGLPKSNPDFIFNASHGGAFNSEYPVTGAWNKTNKRSWIRIESYYHRANPPEIKIEMPPGITGGR